jgi:hypothetical protein
MVHFGNGPFWLWDETSGSDFLLPNLTIVLWNSKNLTKTPDKLCNRKCYIATAKDDNSNCERYLHRERGSEPDC